MTNRRNFHVKYNTLYFTFVKVCSPRVKARTWLVPDSQSQKQKNNRCCRFFFLVTEMRFSPLRFSATVANSFPRSSKKTMGFAQTHEEKFPLDPLQKTPPTPSLFEGAPSPVGRTKQSFVNAERVENQWLVSTP